VKCTQKVIQEKELERQMIEYLDSIHLSKRLLDLGLAYLEKESGESRNREETYKLSMEKARRECERRLENLKQMRLGDLINDDEFLREKRRLIDEKIRLDHSLSDLSQGSNYYQEMTKKTLTFAHNAMESFIKGAPEVKKSLINEFGSNFFLKDKKLSIDVTKPFQLVQKTLNTPPAENGRIEPSNNVMDTNSLMPNNPEFLLMWSLVDDVRTFYEDESRKQRDPIRHAA
jgi:hypothetical protein